MTASDVLLDTWAWWELLCDTPLGQRLRKRYFGRAGLRVHTSVLTLAEIGAKIADLGQSARVAAVLAGIRASSTLQEVSASIAEVAGPLRAELRRRSPNAGLIDALLLATSRSIGARLVSGDSAFRGAPDVVQF